MALPLLRFGLAKPPSNRFLVEPDSGGLLRLGLLRRLRCASGCVLGDDVHLGRLLGTVRLEPLWRRLPFPAAFEVPDARAFVVLVHVHDA